MSPYVPLFPYNVYYISFEKETKTIEDQGQKQIKAIKDSKKQQANNNADDYQNEFLISKEREIQQFYSINKKTPQKLFK